MEEEKEKESEEKIEAKTKSRTFLTVLVTIIVTLIVLLLLSFTWLLIKNPFNLRGILLYKLGWTNELVQIVPIEKTEADQNATESTNSSSTSPITVPLVAPIPMTAAQKEAVENFGIDPNSLVITPAMESCFAEKIGQGRVDAIKDGATPGALELLKGSSCL